MYKKRKLLLSFALSTLIGMFMCTSSAVADDADPSTAYLKYYETLKNAKSPSELLPFMSERRRESFAKKIDKEGARRDLIDAQKSAPSDLQVLYFKIHGPHAVLESTGLFSQFRDDVPPVRRWSNVRLVKEDSGWKLLSESWLDHKISLQPRRDGPTLKWCAAAATAEISDTALAGTFTGKTHKFADARFNAQFHVLTLRMYAALDDTTISLQFPESISDLNGFRLVKPGAALNGLHVGYETDNRGGAGRVFNIMDNDDPFGLQLQCAQDAQGCVNCRMDLRLPDACRSHLSGTFPVEVKN